MDFLEDLFERKHKQGHGHSSDHDDYQPSRKQHGYEDDYEYNRHDHSALIGRLRQNKKLLFLFLVLAVIILIAHIAARRQVLPARFRPAARIMDTLVSGCLGEIGATWF